MELTGPKMLNAAYDEYITDSRAVSAAVHVVQPEIFYPLFDDTTGALVKNCDTEHLRRSCNERLAPDVCLRRTQICASLRDRGFQNMPSYPKTSMAVHHWSHTWIAGYEHAGERECSRDVDIITRRPHDELYGPQLVARVRDCIVSAARVGSDVTIRPGISSACEADKRRFCAEVVPGNGRTHRCMDEHLSDLSEACRRAEYGTVGPSKAGSRFLRHLLLA